MVITVENLSFSRNDDAGYMDLVIEGGGVEITVAGVPLMPEDRERLVRALEAHNAALRALKGQSCTESCTECSESRNATWVPDHITDVNAFPDLRF